MNTKVLLSASLLGFVAISTASAAIADDLHFTGEQIFKNVCNACHAMPNLNNNAIGPSLHGVVGRHAGRAPGYTYSSAMKDSNIVWTEEHLDGYLTNPKRYVGPIGYPPHKEIKLVFSGFDDPADRNAVIAYLKTN